MKREVTQQEYDKGLAVRRVIEKAFLVISASEGDEDAALCLDNGIIIRYNGVYFTREEYAELEYDRLQDIRMDAETPEPEDKDDEKEKD